MAARKNDVEDQTVAVISRDRQRGRRKKDERARGGKVVTAAACCGFGRQGSTMLCTFVWTTVIRMSWAFNSTGFNTHQFSVVRSDRFRRK